VLSQIDDYANYPYAVAIGLVLLALILILIAVLTLIQQRTSGIQLRFRGVT
jgi:ABC-type spermidine/putrescine transport system permease subunit I